MAADKRSASAKKRGQREVVDHTRTDWLPYEGESQDHLRSDLSARLVRIRPMDAVRFVFNDVVDRKTFRVRRTAAEPNTLSISYSDDVRDAAREEASATSSREHWVQSRSSSVSGYGQYAWHDSRTLLIGPPEGGWPAGKLVFFEFDKSLSDDEGNALKGGRDQVVMARVQSDARCVILRPEMDDWFIPWRGGDDIFGRAEDFSVLVVGQIIQHGATRFPSKVVVTATSNLGLVVTTEIMCGDHERRELRKGLGWSDWVPDQQFGGQWAIRLKLQSESWSGKGAQAVAEGHHTWSISAVAVMAAGIRVKASNKKLVRFELYQPRLLMLFCPQIRENHGVVYHWKHGRRKMSRFNFGRRDLGLKQFILVFDGDYDLSQGFSFTNTYISESARSEVLYWERRWSRTLRRWVTWVYLPGFHIHNRVRDVLVNGRYRNRTTHSFTIKITTIAGFVIRISFPFEVDTLPLDLVDVAAIRGHFLRSGRFDIDTISAADGGFYISYGGAGRERVFVSYADVEVIAGQAGGDLDIDWDDLGLDVAVTTAWDDLIVGSEITEEIEVSETVVMEGDIQIEELLEEYGGGMFAMAGEVLVVDSGATVIDEDVILGGGWSTGSSHWRVEEEIEFESDEEFEDFDLSGSAEEESDDVWCDDIGDTVKVVGALRHESMIASSGKTMMIHSIVDREGVEWVLVGKGLDEIEQGQTLAVVGTVNAECAIEIEDMRLLEEKPGAEGPRRIPPAPVDRQRIPQPPVVRQRIPQPPVVRRRIPPND
jgi:hypothetical protein